MGSANGCCKNPKIDNTGLNTNGNEAGQVNKNSTGKQYGGAWGDTTTTAANNGSSNGHVNVSFNHSQASLKQDGPGPPPGQEHSTGAADSSKTVDRGTVSLPVAGRGKTSLSSGGKLVTEIIPAKNGKKIIKMATIGALQIQKPAPAFAGTAVVNGQFQEISLDDYKGKYLVLFFYPLDFTFVCPTEIIAYSEAAESFRNINCEIVAASTDSHFSHFAWVSTPRKQGGLGEMNIPLLADKTGDIARSYGVYKEDEGIAFRGLFIIDDKQNLRQITINDLPVGRSVEETLRLVQAFQFTDKHGEVCPAGWKPGDKTIKPNIEESKEFFKESA